MRIAGGEDGISGLCDGHGFLRLSVAVWNRRDERLKERWFGLTNRGQYLTGITGGRVRSPGAWGPAAFNDRSSRTDPRT